MEIKRKSFFKDNKADLAYFESWVNRLEQHNNRQYERFEIATALGKTHVWGLNTKEDLADTLVIFPGARTTALILDFDKGLNNLKHRMKIYLVETNGLPNLSNGDTPEIKSLDYGIWAAEVLDKLNIDKAFIGGASFGGLICMKLAIVKPEKIKAVFLLNPGCLQPFSLTLKNLYYNLLPIIKPTKKNVLKFLDKAVFAKPNHQLSPFSEGMLVDYEVFAISRYKDLTQKPYYMEEQLSKVAVDTYLLEGDKDLLFPYEQSIRNAETFIPFLKDVEVFSNVGHGIETYDKAMNYIGTKIRQHQPEISLQQNTYQ